MLLSALLLILQPAAVAQPDRFGLPACSAPNQELAARSTFLLCFDSSLKIPVWTAHEISPAASARVPVSRPTRFRHDYELSGPSAFNYDFANSGFSRGHLVPARDLAASEEAMRATFLLSNSVPQVQSMNAGSWQRIESKLRTLATSADSVIIITGVLLESDSPTFIGPNHVAVPSALFKVALVLHGDQKTMYAAIVPNAENVRQPLDNYSVSVDEIQRRTHWDFFNKMDPTEQQRLESVRNVF